MPSLVTNKFQLPSNGEDVSDGDGKNLVAIPIDYGNQIFFITIMASLWHFLQKPSSKAFQKHVTCPPFLATKKIWSPSNIPPLSNDN